MPSDGKTCIGMEILIANRFESVGQSVIIRNPEDWRQLDKTKEYSILLDDILGKYSLDDRKLCKWGDYFPEMFDLVKGGKIKMVLTCRETVFSACENELPLSSLFNHTHIVHLSGSLDGEQSMGKNCPLTVEEKYDMIVQYISKASEFSVYFCEDYEENFNDYKISRDTLNAIAREGSSLAFPQCCNKFVSDSQCFKRGMSFFKQPTEVVIGDLNRMCSSPKRHEKLNYWILVCILVHGGLHVEEVDNVNLTDGIIAYVAKACGLLPASLSSFEAREAIYRLTSSYITRSRDIYSFKHVAMTEAIFTSFFRHGPKLLIDYCHFDLLNNLITAENVSKESDWLCKLTTRCNEIFCNRLLKEITKEGRPLSDLRIVVTHRVFNDQEFVNLFWSYISHQTRASVIRLCDFVDISAMYSCEHFVRHLMGDMQKILPRHELQGRLCKIISECIRSGLYGRYKYFISYCTIVSTTWLSSAASLGHRYTLRDLLARVNWKRKRKSVALSLACRSCRYNTYAVLMSRDSTRLVTNNVLKQAALGAVELSNTKVVDDLKKRGFAIQRYYQEILKKSLTIIPISSTSTC